MSSRLRSLMVVPAVWLFTIFVTFSAHADDTSWALEAVVTVGKLGDGFGKAQQAAQTLRSMPPSELTSLMQQMSDASPVGRNWLRGIARDIVRQSGSTPIEMLTAYVRDHSNDPYGRDLAISLIQDESPETATELIREGLNDPSLLIRELAIADAMQQAKSFVSDSPEKALERYRETLTSARNPKQVSELLTALADLGETITTADAFAMMKSWQVIGPFDNREGVGYDRVYQPESDFAEEGAIDFEQSLEGKNGDVTWQPIEATSDEGEVDFAEKYEKEKGAACYAYAEFKSASEQPAQIRLGCINANKVWLNGELVMANKVYHSGSMIDQYIVDVTLKSGINRILIKSCQNEQTQPWAQDWKFQCRLTDPSGKGLTSQP